MAGANAITESCEMLFEIVCKANALDDAVDSTDLKKVRAMSGEVHFSEDYMLLFKQHAFAFFAEYRGKELRCIVSCKFLKRAFDDRLMTVLDMRSTFLAKRSILQEFARFLIQEGIYMEGSDVVIG